MHEMGIAQSLLEIAESEISPLGCSHIRKLTVHYGQIAGIMPEALQMAFEALASAGPHAGAELELIELPLLLACPFCGKHFRGAEGGNIIQPCPKCGEELGHKVEQGLELILARIEAV